MSDQSSPRSSIAAILIVADDPQTEALLGRLVELAGHRPLYDVTGGASGEVIRRALPDIALLDTALPREVLRACLDAAQETGCRPIFTSSTASPSDLLDDAGSTEHLVFALPNGPRLLPKLVDHALGERRARPQITLPATREEETWSQSRKTQRGEQAGHRKVSQ